MITSLEHLHPQVLAVKLTVEGERSVRKEHPWIFSNSILKINKEGTAGDIAVIFSKKDNKPMGIGLYDPHSPIAIKMIHFGSGARLDNSFFKEQISKAYVIRKSLLKTETNGYRILFGENDHFPGLIADVYDTVLVIKLYSAIWGPYLNTILPILLSMTKTETIVLRLSRSLQKDDHFYSLNDGSVVFGNLANETILFKEHGVSFSANVIKGHKTGYFLDHRENRKRVGEFSKGKSVLDVFSYAGGFSVHALANDANEVISVDISKQALNLAIENGKLNENSGMHKTIAGDAFEVLNTLIKEKRKFDVVVIDPPSFAKSKKEIDLAIKKYKQLTELGIQLTKNKGILVLASCSSRVTADAFFEIHKLVFQQQKTKYKVIDTTFHDTDHPIAFPEGAYLKTRYYQIDY